MQTDSKEQIRNELLAIEVRLNTLAREKQADQLRQITNRLQTTAAAMEHDRKAAAYLAWAESKAYVDQLKEEVEKQGVTAVNPSTGTSHKLQLSADGRSGRVFGNLKAGSIYELSGRPHLVTDFSFSPAGSDATLLPLNAKYQATDRPVTPYSAVPCNFDRATKTLTVAPADRLQPGQQITIDGQKYSLAAQIGIDPGKIRYELTEATA